MLFLKKRLYFIGRRLLLAPFIIYIYDLIMGTSVYFIPINIITILIVGLFDIFGLILLIVLLLIL